MNYSGCIHILIFACVAVISALMIDLCVTFYHGVWLWTKGDRSIVFYL